MKYGCAVAALLLSGAPLNAGDAAGDAKLFGARHSVLDVSLSPDGNGIAYISPGPGSSEVLYVVDLAGSSAPRPVLKVTNADEDLQSCRWANDARLVCRISLIANQGGQLLGFSRLYVLDKDGSNVSELTAGTNTRSLGIVQHGGSIVALDVAGTADKILMTRVFVPEASTGTLLARSSEGLGVEQVDIRNGRRSTTEEGRSSAIWYIADENGNVRMMGTRASDSGGYAGSEVTYHYRTKDSRKWQEFGRAVSDSQTLDGFHPVAVDSAKDVIYGFEGIDGNSALVTYSLDGAKKRTVLLARNDVDVDDLLRIGRRDRVVGASWATERREVAFFDPELKSLAAALQKALPGNPLIEFVGASQDEGKLLLIASSDVDPGSLYLFDKASKNLALVLKLRPELGSTRMAEMKPVTFPAADGTQIPGYLTLPPGSDGKGLPAIVLPHGGPTARDEWGFDWLAQFFAARGYAVLQPNFRGSSGYGQAWFQENGFKSWRTAVGDVNDAGRWLVSQGIADPESLGIVGWSYGGYAALQSQVLDPQLYKAVVAIAPVTDLKRLVEDHRDYTDYRLVASFVGDGAHVTEGSPAQNVGAFAAPVLMFHGDRDQNVDIGHARLMRDRLRSAGKTVELVEFDHTDHYVDDGDKRPAMLEKIDRFLSTRLGKGG